MSSISYPHALFLTGLIVINCGNAPHHNLSGLFFSALGLLGIIIDDKVNRENRK